MGGDPAADGRGSRFCAGQGSDPGMSEESTVTPGSSPEAGVFVPTGRYLELELGGGSLQGGG